MRLENDSIFPGLSAVDSMDVAVALHDLVGGHWSVVFLYRGHW